MKKFFVNFCVTLFVFGIADAAMALPSYIDSYDAEHTYLSQGGSKSWTFDIKNDGFIPEIQDVTSAYVTLSLSDDSLDIKHWFEKAVLDVGTNKFKWEVDTGDVNFTITSLITLSNYGTVDAILKCQKGDFFFDAAYLYAEGTDLPTAHASEPVSMFMFGSGLIGVAFLGRKKFGKV